MSVAAGSPRHATGSRSARCASPRRSWCAEGCTDARPGDMKPDDLIVTRPEGLFCPPGGFYVDPWRPVDRAIITHAHSDHARARQHDVISPRRRPNTCCARGSATSRCRSIDYGETLDINGVTRLAASGRPCARLGAGATGLRRPCVGGIGRLQARSRSDLCAVRTGAVRRFRHRVDVRAADVIAGRTPRWCFPISTPGGRATRPRAEPASSIATRSAKRSGSSPASTPRPVRCSAMARSSA